MEIRDRRLLALRRLLQERNESRVTLAKDIGKSPSQISQWLSGHRTITEETARSIEARAGKPRGWMDNELPASLAQPSPPPLPAALPVVLDLLERADDVTRPAIQAALHRLIDDPSQLDGTLALLELLRKGAATETAAFVKPKDPA